MLGYAPVTLLLAIARDHFAITKTRIGRKEVTSSRIMVANGRQPIIDHCHKEIATNALKTSLRQNWSHGDR